MQAQNQDLRAFVVSKDAAFFQTIADHLRQRPSPPRGLLRLTRIADLPAAVSFADLVVVDARNCREPLTPVLRLPCRKIFLDGTGDAAMADLRTLLDLSPPPGRSSRPLLAADPQSGHEDESHTASRREQMLLTFAGRLATLKPDNINDACREILPSLVGAARASGYLHKPAMNRLELAWHAGPEPLAPSVPISPFLNDSPMALAVNRRRAWLATDVDRELTQMGLALERPFAKGYRTGSCMVVPVIYGAELLGVINFADPVRGRAFDRDRAEPLLDGIAHLLAAAWQNVSVVAGLEQQARTDGLSGLANFRAFEQTLTRETIRARRYGLPLSLILMDVNNLKQVNDRYGHPAGDLLLREVARRIAGAVRETDFPARHGGDEFSVILPSTDRVAAHQVVERVTQAVNGAAVHWLRHVFRTSVSIAFAEYDGESVPSRFVADVDALVYANKRAHSANAVE